MGERCEKCHGLHGLPVTDAEASEFCAGGWVCMLVAGGYKRGLADGVKMAKLKAFPNSLTFSSIDWTYVDAALEEATR